MPIEVQFGILIVLTYFVGSIPFGLLVAKTKGCDPRQFGSGNIGATNVGRMLGGKFFAIVFSLDLLKGMVPMLIGAWLIRSYPVTEKPYLWWMLVGLAALLGHIFPVYLKFKGGKGVATATGVLLGLFPYYTIPGLIVMGIFIVIFLIWRMVSLGSMVCALAFTPVYMLVGYAWGWPVTRQQLPLLIFAVVMSLLILWKHRSNFKRILAGTEHVFRKT
ncbi:MAG: glycerol-3-phosphate acyltransferase [Phycisphaerae bacterium]|jgi:glycerol-3-phosphate acyltransferase PlsY|nr:MAG: glycerol-3-phosphate acyltransferase [Phycisphaerae bacterium]